MYDERQDGCGGDETSYEVGGFPHFPLFHRPEEAEHHGSAIEIIGAWEV
jgi:hypothetical protein